MKQFYVGVKIVQAWPEERNGDPGYAVKYEDGYTSWSPKNVFEFAYLPMGNGNYNKVTSDMVDVLTGKEYDATQLDEKTTLLKCKTATGFVQYETSSCVDPANFDMETGSEICLDRVRCAMWKFLGFVVQWGRYGLKNHVD